jgi:hypothetical protein
MLPRVNPHGPPAFVALRHGRQGRGYILWRRSAKEGHEKSVA